MSVGLALIVRDEEENLPGLLESIKGCFDAVALVDTGSEDRTIEIFEEWALDELCENVEFKHTVAHFDWIKDFAAARTFADATLLSLGVDWHVWADADDVIVGAERIRELVDNAAPEVAALVCGYDYAQHPETGACVCHLRRERMVRSGKGTWVGRVHEAQIIHGPSQYVPDDIIQWKHQKLVSTTDEAAAVRSNTRNLEILEKWAEDEPEHSRVLAYVGVENAVRGEHHRAIEFYRRYLDLHSTWDEERAQVYRRLCASLMAVGKHDECIPLAFEAMGTLPTWPDSHITLAEVYLTKGDPKRAIHWAVQAAEMGVPETLLIINPLDYTFHTWEMVAVARALLGELDEAVTAAETALGYFPDQVLAHRAMAWRSDLKRERTAQTYMMCAQQLVGHDEQAKALILLEQCVPYFATDHPQIVAYRSFVRQRLSWVNHPDLYAAHYADGGDKPENWVDDEDAVAGVLPRCEFLKTGIAEQMADA